MGPNQRFKEAITVPLNMHLILGILPVSYSLAVDQLFFTTTWHCWGRGGYTHIQDRLQSVWHVNIL